MKSFFCQYHCKLLANLTFKYVTQVRTNECSIKTFFCKVNFNFLRSSRLFYCDRAFDVIVSLLDEVVHDFHDISDISSKIWVPDSRILKRLKLFSKSKNLISLSNFLGH